MLGIKCTRQIQTEDYGNVSSMDVIILGQLVPSVKVP